MLLIYCLILFFIGAEASHAYMIISPLSDFISTQRIKREIWQLCPHRQCTMSFFLYFKIYFQIKGIPSCTHLGCTDAKFKHISSCIPYWRYFCYCVDRIKIFSHIAFEACNLLVLSTDTPADFMLRFWWSSSSGTVYCTVEPHLLSWCHYSNHRFHKKTHQDWNVEEFCSCLQKMTAVFLTLDTSARWVFMSWSLTGTICLMPL